MAGVIGRRMVECRSLTVRAHLQQGAVLDQHWPAPLDGILAAALRRQRLGSVYGTAVDHHVEPLPLARWTADVGKQWHWMATCARPVGKSERELHWWHSRFDHARAETIVSNLPPIVRANQGRFRSYRTPLPVTVAGTLEWRTVGDPMAIEEALMLVWAVGKKRSQGEGFVVRWEVVDEGPAVAAWALWWDGVIARPVSARLAPYLAPGADLVDAPLRPPYFQAKRLRHALAPWTTRP